MARSTLDKSTQKLTVNSDNTMADAIKKVASMYGDHRYLVISIRPGKDRSLEQQGLWWKMYKRIEESTFQGTDKEVWAFCKLMIGVPIMRRDDVGFEKGWCRYFADKSFEEQLYLMGPNPLFGPDGFPVTSLFSTAQGSEYTNGIADYYAPQRVDFSDLLKGRK